jgi:hypothetical protein
VLHVELLLREYIFRSTAPAASLKRWKSISILPVEVQWAIFPALDTEA